MTRYPYFKFYPGEWMNGNITLCSFEAQGVFINICSYYWNAECSVSLAVAQQRFSGRSAFDELIKNNVIKVENDMIIISFLNEYFDEFSSISKRNSINGSKRLAATVKRPLSDPPANKSNKNKNKNKNSNKDNDKNKERDKRFVPPLIGDVVNYFKENGYSDQSAEKFYKYYETGLWKDSKGNQVKNWKQKAQAVWFKEENKIKQPDNKRTFVS